LVLAELADAARPRARRADPLLAELERAIALVPLADLPVVTRTLEEACVAIDRDGVRAELSALVRAISGTSGRSSEDRRGGAPLQAPSSVAADRGRPAGAARAAAARGDAQARGVAALGRSSSRSCCSRSRSCATTSPPTSTCPGCGFDRRPPRHPRLSLIPGSTGETVARSTCALDRCTPGTPCTMRVLVQLVPTAARRP
jgi:hypothetical protein